MYLKLLKTLYQRQKFIKLQHRKCLEKLKQRLKMRILDLNPPTLMQQPNFMLIKWQVSQGEIESSHNLLYAESYLTTKVQDEDLTLLQEKFLLQQPALKI